MKKNDENIERQFGDWAVLKNGDIENYRLKLEIANDRLNESSYLEFMLAQKIDMNEFLPAFLYACRKMKVDAIKLNAR